MATENRHSSLSILHRACTAGWAKHKRCNINAALFSTPTLGSHPDQLSPAGRTSHPSKGTTASQNHPSLHCPPLHRVRKPRKSTLLAPSSCSLVKMRLPGLLNRTEGSWLRSWQQNYQGVSEHLVNQRFFTWVCRASGTGGIILYNTNELFVTTLRWKYGSSTDATRSYRRISNSLHAASSSPCKCKPCVQEITPAIFFVLECPGWRDRNTLW